MFISSLYQRNGLQCALLWLWFYPSLNTSVQDFWAWSKICPASILKLPFIGSRWMTVKEFTHSLSYSDCQIKVHIFLSLSFLHKVLGFVSSSIGLHPVKEVCESRGFVPWIPVTGPLLFSSLPLPPSLMLCLSTDNSPLVLFPWGIPKATPELKDEQKGVGGTRLRLQPPGLPASLLSSKPHCYCKGLGWELEAEELFRN